MAHRIIFSAFVLMLGWWPLYGQLDLRGRVANEKGLPLAQATVQVKGTSIQTVTDADGRFWLSVSPFDQLLMVSKKGYRTVEASIGQQDELVIRLSLLFNPLTEVVHTGLEEVSRQVLPGNVKRIGGDLMGTDGGYSLPARMPGRSPGLFSQTISGELGSRALVRIRGSRSFLGNNDPLVLVDGFPVFAGVFPTPGAGSQSFLSALGGAGITSVQVLRDAVDTAPFGIRGSNGVILIETHRSRGEGPGVLFRYDLGVGMPARERSFLDSEGYLELLTLSADAGARRDWALGLDRFGLGAAYDETTNRQAYLGYLERSLDRLTGGADWRNNPADTDWSSRSARQNALSQRASAAFLGAEGPLTYRASMEFLRQDGVYPGDERDRLSADVAFSRRENDRYFWDARFDFVRIEASLNGADPLPTNPLYLLTLPPVVPADSLGGLPPADPLALIGRRAQELIHQQSGGQWRGGLFLTQGLQLTGQAGFRHFSANHRGYGRPGSALFSEQGSVWRYQGGAALHFDRELGDRGHHLTARIGGEAVRTDLRDLPGAAAAGAVPDAILELPVLPLPTGYSGAFGYSLWGGYGMVRYDYQGRLLFQGSIRRDAFVQEGEVTFAGVYPALGAGWVISEEAFMKYAALVSYLKVRGGWGLTGNAQHGVFPVLGPLPPANASGGLDPERTRQWNVGLDLGLFNNRVTATIDHYRSRSEELFFDPEAWGANQWINGGSVENHGWEVGLEAALTGGALAWETGLFLSFNRNEVIRLDGVRQVWAPGGANLMNALLVGQPMGVFYGADYAGVDADTGDALYFNNTGDETFVTPDLNEVGFTALGSPLPKVVLGWNHGLTLGAFRLELAFHGAFGHYLHDAAGPLTACNGCGLANQERFQINAWRQAGEQTPVPEARLLFANGSFARSSRYLEPGDFVRLRQLSFSYSVPDYALARAGLKQLRIYFNAWNLLTITRYPGDPEAAADGILDLQPNLFQGVQLLSPPHIRTLQLGLEVGF